MSRFLKENDILIQKLSNPEVNKQQLVDVIKEMHKVTNSVAVLGAIEIHAKLQNVKIKGESGLSENLWNAVDKLGPVWSRVKSSLKKWLNPLLTLNLTRIELSIRQFF